MRGIPLSRAARGSNERWRVNNLGERNRIRRALRSDSCEVVSLFMLSQRDAMTMLETPSTSLAFLTEVYRAYQIAETRRWAALAAAGVASWADVFEIAAHTHADRIAVVQVSNGRSWTYAALDQAANRVAAWAKARGEPCIALYKENGFAFLAAAIGLAKAGVLAVLINDREPPQRAATLAAGAGATTVLGNPVPGLAAAPSIEELLATRYPRRIPAAVRREIDLDDPCWIIFTSGTSGRSKGAHFSHRRMIGAGIAWSLRAGLVSSDRCYTPLPLCHGNALAIAFSSCVSIGAAIVLRERFSARSFLDDIRTHRCTAAVYIGELWRYLDRIPPKPEDSDTPLRVIFGNGLGRDLWTRTVRRFGIQHVVEHYGATELPAAALTNWTGRAGFCGFIPPEHPDHTDVALVRAEGRRVAPGEVGELVLRVEGGVYRGYVDAWDDLAKVTRSLFEPGDLWWRSGDLLTLDRDGFFTFVERMGDGYRWKGENVAARDVENAIRATGLVRDATVYGVALPNHDGKAGMASIVALEEDCLPDLDALYAALRATLAPFALPRFLRVGWSDPPTTATLKVTKAALAKDAFNRVGLEPLFVLHGDGYVPLSADWFNDLCTGKGMLT